MRTLDHRHLHDAQALNGSRPPNSLRSTEFGSGWRLQSPVVCSHTQPFPLSRDPVGCMDGLRWQLVFAHRPVSPPTRVLRASPSVTVQLPRTVSVVFQGTAGCATFMRYPRFSYKGSATLTTLFPHPRRPGEV